MPIISGSGEWWTQNSRPVLKVRTGAVSADVEQGDVASCAVTSGTIAGSAVKAGHLAAGAVDAAAAVADGIVTSEKATSYLRHRTVSFTINGPSSSAAAGVATVESTSVAIWRPRTAINVLQLSALTLGLYENATCDMFVLYGNAGTCIGQVSLKAVAGSTALSRGVLTTGSAITRAALAADTPVYLKHVTSTCSIPSAVILVLDYESTG